jgi:DnaK suppressor protein
VQERERIAGEREATERRVTSLTSALADVIDSIRDGGNDDEHDPDGSTVAFERAQVIALLRQARESLEALDAAAERLDRGTFGVCERCGSTIPPERLEARPTATTCVSCASS